MNKEVLKMCDHCAHEGLCKYEKDLRDYIERMDLPTGKYFVVDVVCNLRTAPQVTVKAKKLNVDDYILSQFPEIHGGTK